MADGPIDSPPRDETIPGAHEYAVPIARPLTPATADVTLAHALPLPPAPPMKVRKPRPFWWGLGLVVLVLLVGLALQTLMGGCLGFFVGASGGNTETVVQFFGTPTGIVISMAMMQLGMLLIIARIARPAAQRRDRLGLSWPHLSAVDFLLIIPGTICVALLATLFAMILAPLGDQFEESPVNLWRSITPSDYWIWVSFIAFAPGLCEELMFRGLIQRRLLSVWRPWAAILYTSALFAALHLTPVHMLFAFPLGLWFGFIAYRTGSVWPSSFCHAFVNGAWNIYHIHIVQAEWTDDADSDVKFAALFATLPMLLLALWKLRKQAPGAVPTWPGLEAIAQQPASPAETVRADTQSPNELPQSTG